MDVFAGVSTVGQASLLEPVWTTPTQLTGDFISLAIVFFVLAIIAAAVGAGRVAGVTMTIAKWFVIIFIVLAIASLLL